MAFWALKPHAHVFIFTSRLLGSHLFKHLKNTLLSPAREPLDQQTLGMCCRVNVAPKIDGRRDLSVKKPGNRSQLLRGVYQERTEWKWSWYYWSSLHTFYVDWLLADWRIDQLCAIFNTKASTAHIYGVLRETACSWRLRTDIVGKRSRKTEGQWTGLMK